MILEQSYNRTLNKLKSNKHITKLNYLRLLGETAKKIIQKGSKQLNINDYKDIALKVYKKNGYILARSIKRMMETDLARTQVNTALIEFYSQAGLNKDEAIKMLNLAKDTAIEKKDIGNLLKIVEKYESASNLSDNKGVKATYRETTDFSKLGKDGRPEVKTTKTLEITKNEAIGSLESNDKEVGNDNVPTENE